MKDVEYEYVEINRAIVAYVSKMAAKMAAEILNLMYLSSAFGCKDVNEVHYLYEVKDVTSVKYEEILKYSRLHNFQDGDQDGRQKSDSNISQIFLRDTKTIKVSPTDCS